MRDISKNNFQFLDEEEGEEMDDVTHLFPNSKLPPVQLPLDYSLHTKHKTVASKPIKNKGGNDSYTRRCTHCSGRLSNNVYFYS